MKTYISKILEIFVKIAGKGTGFLALQKIFKCFTETVV